MTRAVARSRFLALTAGLMASASALPAAAENFVDPTAAVPTRGVTIGDEVYVGPFALFQVRTGGDDDDGRPTTITIGAESNVQDNVRIDARQRSVTLGERVILAHAATVKNSVIGVEGECLDGTEICPSFVGFNAVVDGAIVEKDAMVSALARVGPGVRIPSGRKVVSGANVTSQAQVLAKSVAMQPGDSLFMEGVIRVNTELAEGYAALEARGPNNVRGINIDPDTEFNPGEDVPSLGGVPVVDPRFRNRIIGDITLKNTKAQLTTARMASKVALRADEGTPFRIGTIKRMETGVAVHALEGSSITLGDNGTYGAHAVVHGGPAPSATTSTGVNVTVDDWAVLFRSTLGAGSKVGRKSLVQASTLGTVNIPPCQVWIGDVYAQAVEWCNITP